MGHYCDDEGIFVATNATNFPQGLTNGALRFTISDTEECNSDALDRALEFQLDDPVNYEINDFGMIEGTERGWFAQAISELQGNSTLPVSLAELVRGSESEYSLAVYLLSSDDKLLGCASMKKHDEDTAAQYYELLNGDSQEAVKDAPSSGSKIGLFVSVSAIAAIGFSAVLGDVFAWELRLGVDVDIFVREEELESILP